MSDFLDAISELECPLDRDERVLMPRSTSELARVVRLAREQTARLAPPGAVSRDSSAVRIDLRHMASIIAVDDSSQIAHVGAGLDLAALEGEVGRRGLTLGLGPRASQPVGQWLARGAPGARSRQDDPVDQLLAGFEAVLPDGRTLAIRPAPRRAVGPDLCGAFVGAWGRLGILTAVHLVTRRRDPAEVVAYQFDDRQSAEAAQAWVRGRGVRPAASHLIGPVLRVELTGRGALLAARRSVVESVASARGGVAIDAPSIAPASAVAEPSEVVRALGAQLDESGVLG